MSTLSTANIQSKAANTPPVIKDLNGTKVGTFVRAWACFDGVNDTLFDGFNIASITDDGLAKYTITLTTAFPDTNWAWVGSSGQDSVNQNNWISGPAATARSTWKTASSVQIWATYQNTLVDTEPKEINFMAFYN